MAGNIKGIIVEIGGDTSGLQNALKKVNSATASLSKELKGINSLLKLDPKNTELVAQKQTVLKQKISETSKQLELLKEAQKQYIQSGGNLNTAEYRNLQREIIKTEAELKNLKIEASSWTQASKNLSDLSNKMTNLGNKISEVGQKVSVLSAAIASLLVVGTKYNADMERYTVAFETFLGSADAATDALENIKKQAESSPFDTSELIKANQMIITTGENADDTRATISALADAIALTGGGNDELSRMAANLQQIKNAGKATSMDIRQFAYAGIDVYGILSETTGKTVEEIKKSDVTYEDLSKALRNAAAEGGKYFGGQSKMAETLSGQINKLKKSFKDLLGELSSSLYPVIKKITDRLQKLVEWFKNLDDGTKETIAKIGVFVAALGPALVIIGKIISFGGSIAGGLSKIATIIAKLTASTGGLSGAISALSNPVGIAIAVVAALTAAFIYLWKTNEEFRENIKEIWNKIVSFFNEEIVPKFTELVEFYKEILNEIWENVSTIWHDSLEPMINEALKWFSKFWDETLKDVLSEALQLVMNLIQYWVKLDMAVLKPIMAAIKQLWPVIEWLFENVLSGITSAYEFIFKIIKNIMGIFNGLITFIEGVFTGDWTKAWEGVKTIFKNIVEGLGEIIKEPINAIIGSINAFIRGINKVQIPDWVPNVGGKGINIPLIPKLAKGGIVDKATIAMIGEGKSAEAVIPLDRTLAKYMAEALKIAGGSDRNIVVNFYPQQMNEAELDRAFNYIDRRFGMSY